MLQLTRKGRYQLVYFFDNDKYAILRDGTMIDESNVAAYICNKFKRL